MRFILLHYHIFKNAGSTIEENLEHSFHEKFLRFDTPDRNGELDHANLLACLNAHPQVSAVSSHQIHYPVPQAPGILFFDLCFLRDPIDRIRSIYDYFRQKPSLGDPMSDLANHRSRGAFIRHLIENLPWTVSDVQVNLLANGQVSDLARGPEDLQLATARMLETSFLGVVDLFRESLIAGRHALRVIFPNLVCAHPPVNVSKGLHGTPEQRSRAFREDCGERLYRELQRLNEMDFELLRMARDEVQRRFELVPDCAERMTGEESSFNTPVPGLLDRLKHLVPRLSKKENPLFDPDYYLDHNSDVREAGVNPLLHYVSHGAAEGRKPNPLFDPRYYSTHCPEARRAGRNPLTHFLEGGPQAWRNPHVLFDCESYLREHPEAGSPGENPLAHYLEHSRLEHSRRGPR